MICVDKSTPGVTVWTMPAGEHMANPVGVVQGGFLAAFADSAMATATVTNLQGRRAYTANTDLTISFLRGAPVGENLTCTARVVGGGKRVTFVEAHITDTSGRLVAKASSTYLITPRTCGLELGQHALGATDVQAETLLHRQIGELTVLDDRRIAL
jgi:uncharacterized protein (TIGR00369 family)